MILGNSHKVEALAAALVNGQPEKFQMLNQPATRPGKRWQSPLEISSSSFFRWFGGRLWRSRWRGEGSWETHHILYIFFVGMHWMTFGPLYIFLQKNGMPPKNSKSRYEIISTHKGLWSIYLVKLMQLVQSQLLHSSLNITYEHKKLGHSLF